MQRPYEDITPDDPPSNLTEQEKKVYDFLWFHVQEKGRWPSYSELMTRFDWKSPNSVTQNMKKLYSKGWIDRIGRGQWRFTSGRCPSCGQVIE